MDEVSRRRENEREKNKLPGFVLDLCMDFSVSGERTSSVSNIINALPVIHFSINNP